jgi:hypothetical protein
VGDETKGDTPGRKGSGAEREGARRRSKGGDDDEDSDFEAEIDPSLINNDLDPITPQTPRAASRAGWVCFHPFFPCPSLPLLLSSFAPLFPSFVVPHIM